MKRKLVMLVSMFALVLGLLVPASTALAANPEVAITVSAAVISITNTQATWAIGVVEVDEFKYFAVDPDVQDDDYSQIANTGNAAVDVEIQGTDLIGTTYDWTLAAAATNQTYSLYAISGNGTGAYNVEVTNAPAYNDLATSLAASDIWNWSMNLTIPDEFHVSDTGDAKSGTVTLVASKS